MSGLTGALLNSANSLDVFARVFQTIENNISNVNTPGYAKQDQLLLSLRFDQAARLNGGVALGPMINSRSEFLEQAVRTQQHSLGDAEQRTGDLGEVQSFFDLTAKS